MKTITTNKGIVMDILLRGGKVLGYKNGTIQEIIYKPNQGCGCDLSEFDSFEITEMKFPGPAIDFIETKLTIGED